MEIYYQNKKQKKIIYITIIKTQRRSVESNKRYKMDSHSIRNILKNFLIGANTILSVSINYQFVEIQTIVKHLRYWGLWHSLSEYG